MKSILFVALVLIVIIIWSEISYKKIMKNYDEEDPEEDFASIDLIPLRDVFITDQGIIYEIFKNKDGLEYIECTSDKTEGTYNLWIGVHTEKTYQGHPVRHTKKGKEFVILTSPKTNNPYCKFI